MIKRREPEAMYRFDPCSYTAVCTAAGHLCPAPSGLRSDGYLTLALMDKYCRAMLPVEKTARFCRGERPTLKEFLEANTSRAVICVLGHYLYADGNTYWSFLKNARDPVVHVWYLKKEGA